MMEDLVSVLIGFDIVSYQYELHIILHWEYMVIHFLLLVMLSVLTASMYKLTYLPLVSSDIFYRFLRRVVCGFRVNSFRHIPVSVSTCTEQRLRLRRPWEAETAEAARRRTHRRRTWAFSRCTSTPRLPVSRSLPEVLSLWPKRSGRSGFHVDEVHRRGTFL